MRYTVLEMPLLPIESDGELDRAIATINSLLDKPALSVSEQGYLDVLSDLVEKYESAQHPLAPVSDGDMLRHLMETKGVTETEVSRATNISASAIADVLNGNHKLARGQTTDLAHYFRVDPAVFTSWQQEP